MMQIIKNDSGFKMTEMWRKWFIPVALAAGVLIGLNRPPRAMTFQSDKEVKPLLVGVIKRYDTNQGCGCYFKTPKEAQKARWQVTGPYIFLDDGVDTLMNIDGKDVALKLLKSKGSGDKVGDKYRNIYRAEDIMVYLDYVVTEVCPPNDQECEWIEADGTITIEQGARKQTIKVKGGRGC
jgi:hypothetical protein